MPGPTYIDDPFLIIVEHHNWEHTNATTLECCFRTPETIMKCLQLLRRKTAFLQNYVLKLQ